MTRSLAPTTTTTEPSPRAFQTLRTRRSVSVTVFVVASAVYLLSPVHVFSDARNAGPTAVSLVTERDLDIDEFSNVEWFGGYQTRFIDGHAYDFYPWTASVLAVPVVITAEAAGWVGIGDGATALVRDHTTERLFLLIPGALTTAGSAAVLAAVAWSMTRSPDRRRSVALTVGFGVAFTTGYWSVASRTLFMHGPACLWLSIALWASIGLSDRTRSSHRAAVIGAAATAAAMTRPTFVFAAAALAGWLLVEHRDRLVAAGAGAVAVATVVTAVNVATFGSMLMPYYSPGRAGKPRPDPILEGVAASLVSPSRGYLIFIPAALGLAGWGLLLMQRQSNFGRLGWFLAAAVTVTFLFQGTSSEGWWAGHTFGPRFSVDIVPMLAVLAVPAIECCLTLGRRPVPVVFAVLSIWAFVVHAQGATIRHTACWNIDPVDIDEDRRQVWDFADSQAVEGIRWVAGGNNPIVLGCEVPEEI